MARIDRYEKKDGTEVSGHTRSAPGSARELTTFGMVVLMAWAVGSGQLHITDEDGKAAPAPRPPASAPVVPGHGDGR